MASLSDEQRCFRIRAIHDAFHGHAGEMAAEIERLRTALRKIAEGDGYYGAQAREYKNVARDALGESHVQ